MFHKGLKFNILIHMGIIIAIAMFLVNLVLITAFNNIMTNSLVAKGRLLASAARTALAVDTHEQEPSDRFDEKMKDFTREAGLKCMVIADKTRRTIFSTQPDHSSRSGVFAPPGCPEFNELDSLVREAFTYGRNEIRFTGTTWGVFWKQPEYLIMASPLHEGSRITGVAGMVFHLESQYQLLRNIQKLLWSYLLVNLAVLTLISLYQVSKVAINPLKRILNRAETYRGDDEIFLTDDIKINELNRLSFSLNRMLRRISEDKTRLKTTIASLTDANAELKQAQQEIIRCEKAASVGRLSSGIAHEIGNPLGIIQGYLGLLRQEDLTKTEKEDFLNRLEQEIKRINTIIRQLLDFSRPDMGKFEPVSVHHIICNLVDMTAALPLMRNIELSFSNNASADIVIGDRNTVRQVLLNLLINAADAVSATHPAENGKIIITTRDITVPDADKNDRKWLAIIFTDNGGGIAEENLDSIFDPFFTTKEPGKGTGLGLWVSYMMVENMGGKIEASRLAGDGTEMTVKLPLIQ